MAKNRVKLNSAGMQSLLNDPKVAAELARRMGPVLAQAQANAPVDTGTYRDSLHIEAAVTDRVVARVVSDVDYALNVEAGTGNLARALDAAGGQ